MSSTSHQISETFIDNYTDLLALCEQLQNVSYLAVDTEFIREKTYYPKLCLIQIAGDDIVACIDPLAITDLNPLLDLLYNPDIVKVFHAARQDLEIFYYLKNAIPAPLFDTQIAAALLGFSDQVAYMNLISELLGVHLDKGHSRTDWAKRPLDPEQLHYAANDVRYLLQAYPLILEQLNAKGRHDWLADDFATLANPELYESHPDDLWKRVSGNSRLKGKQLAALQKLAAWREQQAQAQDRPRKWIVSDDSLAILAQRMPANQAEIGKIRGLNEGVIQKHGQAILDCIEQALSTPVEQWPSHGKHIRLSPQQDALADMLMALIKIQAYTHQVAASVLASRKEIEQFIQGERQLNLLTGWRRKMAGEMALELLNGTRHLLVEQGEPITKV